jgi:hypothetical protein
LINDERAANVRANNAVQVLEVEFGDGRENQDAGGMDNHVHAAKVLFGLVEERHHAGLVGDVTPERNGRTARVGDEFHDFLRLRPIGGVVDHDVHPVGTEAFGHGSADLTRSAGDDRDPGNLRHVH